MAAICRAVDGLPLAIELAAAWVRVLTVEQIAARLTDRFRLLSSAERMASPGTGPCARPSTGAMTCSRPRSGSCCAGSSVFAGWPLEMAEQVCAGPGADGELAAGDVFDLLTGLADKSLVIAEPDAGGRIRYRMLDTIREYAAARLAEAGEQGGCGPGS